MTVIGRIWRGSQLLSAPELADHKPGRWRESGPTFVCEDFQGGRGRRACRGVNECYIRRRRLPGRGPPSGVPGNTQPRPEIADRGRSLQRRLHGQLNPRFPLPLGRTCDRPCEPACRRGRVEEEPVAICRLKRVAADFEDDIRENCSLRSPPRARTESGSRWWRRPRFACGRARPGATRLPVRGVDQDPKAGGMIPYANPALPAAGVDHRRGMRLHPQSRHRLPRRHAHRQSQGLAGRRLGCGLCRVRRAAWARHRDSRPQGSRGERPHRHRLARRCPSVISPRMPERVIVLGGGNTAMDCCRSSRRLGGEDVKRSSVPASKR